MDRPVFVIDEAGDIEVAAGLDEAALSIEVYDVDDVEVFDADGFRYRATDAGDFKVALMPTGVLDAARLDQALRAYAERVDMDLTHVADMRTAVADAIRQWNWEHRWPRRPGWLDRRLHGTRPPERFSHGN